MKNLKIPTIDDEGKKVYKLKSAIIKGYEYTKTYYKMKNGVPVKCEYGNDSYLTVINIRKCGDESKKKRTFILSEGYIGAEKSYNEDGTKRNSITKKDGFGMSYFIKYIENSQENNVDNFHVIFLSNKETSENQATLYAQAIKDITTENIEETYMWDHSKAGFLTIRTLEKMRDSGDELTEKVLKKLKVIITGMPTEGLDDVDRNKKINELNNNRFLNALPFSGHIKNVILAWYDKYLYKPVPAQVDLKKENTQLQRKSIYAKTKWTRLFNTIWGNESFQRRINKTKKVEYDPEYLKRTMSEENLKKIEDIDYIVLPVNLEFSDAMHSLVVHRQIMPLILYAKKKLMQRTEEGEGITTYKEQGVFRKGLKVGKTVIHGSHDMGASSGDGKPNKAKDGKQGRLGALETIAQEFLEK